MASVVSDSVGPHRLQPTRLPRPWDSPGKNTGVGCHFLLQCMKVKSESEVAQLCLTPNNPMDCGPPGSSVHGIFYKSVSSSNPYLIAPSTSSLLKPSVRFPHSIYILRRGRRVLAKHNLNKTTVDQPHLWLLKKRKSFRTFSQVSVPKDCALARPLSPGKCTRLTACFRQPLWGSG